MKIFPIRPVSNLDRLKNLYNMMGASKTAVKNSNIKSDIAAFSEQKPLKKGRSICDMLSE